MGLLDDNLIEVAFDEKEMRKNYRLSWLEKHSCLGLPGIKQVFPYNWHMVRININKDSEDDNAWVVRGVIYELDSDYKGPEGSEEVTQINTSNIICIKPHPNRKYIIANVTDSDLPLFKICTRDKQGGILYCINCTRKIVHKSHKWKYVFLEYDATTNMYTVVEEWPGDKTYKNKRMEESFNANSTQS